jgi:hypothetical protein
MSSRPSISEVVKSANMGEVYHFICIECGNEEGRVANPNIQQTMDNLKLCNSCHADNVDAMSRERSKKYREKAKK